MIKKVNINHIVTSLLENMNQTLNSSNIADAGNEKSLSDTFSVHLQSIITIIGLMANLAALVALIANGKKVPKIGRILFMHQSIADSLVCSMAIGILTQPYMWMTGYSTFDFLICKVWHSQYMYWGAVLSSIWNVVFMAVERFVMINYPYQHRYIEHYHVYKALLTMHIFIIIAMVPVSFYVTYDHQTGMCLNAYPDEVKHVRSLDGILSFALIYAIPATLLIGLYTKNILMIRKRQENLGLVMGQRSQTLDIADQQMTKTAFAVSVVFIITLGPASFHCILGFTGLVEFEYSNDFQIIEVFLATLDSCVTPFIYILFMPIFKQILKETFCVQSMSRQCQFR